MWRPNSPSCSLYSCFLHHLRIEYLGLCVMNVEGNIVCVVVATSRNEVRNIASEANSRRTLSPSCLPGGKLIIMMTVLTILLALIIVFPLRRSRVSNNFVRRTSEATPCICSTPPSTYSTSFPSDRKFCVIFSIS